MKTGAEVEGFHLLENSYSFCLGFQQAMKARTTCFISFINLLISVLTKNNNKYECLYSGFRVAEKLISPSFNTHA